MMIRAKLFTAAALAILTCRAAAQESPPPAPPRGDAPLRDDAANPAVEQFDDNGDGALTGDELGRARAFLQSLRRMVGDQRDRAAGRAGDRPRPPRRADAAAGDERAREARPPRARRGAEGRRPQRRPDAPADAGPPQSPPQRDEPLRLFRRFDANRDGALGPEEFTALMGALRDRRDPAPPEGPQFGPRVDRPDAPRRTQGRGPRPPEGDRPPRGERGRRFDGPPDPPNFGDEGPAGSGPRGPRLRDGQRRPPRDATADADEAPAARWPRPEGVGPAADEIY